MFKTIELAVKVRNDRSNVEMINNVINRNQSNVDYGSAVASLVGPADSVFGLCRLFQPSPNLVIVDVSVRNKQLVGRKLALAIHQYGNLTELGDSCGAVYHGKNNASGELASTTANSVGSVDILCERNDLELCDLIGRSIVLRDADSQTRLACGVIARSAGLTQNVKKICACSGQTLWEEDEMERFKHT